MAAVTQTQEARYPEIEVAGPPRELGRQIGEAAGEAVRGFCEVALERVNLTMRVSRKAAMAVARECIPYAERYSPDMVEELRGTAEAARVPLEDLMLLQVRNQLQPEPLPPQPLQPEPEAGCTSLSLGAPLRAGRVVAQNWDNDPVLDEFTIVLTRRPPGKPALMTVTQAGLIAYIGLNSAGIGLCLNTLPAPSRRLGVPHYFTVRGIYEAGSLDGAAEAVRRAERAIPANVMLSAPEGPADLEITLDDVKVLRDRDTGRVTHTNHCRHPELLAINERFPELIQSHARQRRIDALLDAEPRGDFSVKAVQRMLRDHQDHPRSICRHANGDAAHGLWQTVFSVVIEPEAGRMHISRGTPCDHPYETYRLA